MKTFIGKNLLLFLISVLIVLLLLGGFVLVYNQFRIKPPYELKDYKTTIYIRDNHRLIRKLDKSHYNVIIDTKIQDNPIDSNDYSTFLVSFVAILATFVVIANFANASELSKAKEDAQTAQNNATKAKKDVEELKGNIVEKVAEVEDVREIAKAAIEKANEISSLVDVQKQELDKIASSVSSIKSTLSEKELELMDLYNAMKQEISSHIEQMKLLKIELDTTNNRLGKLENTPEKREVDSTHNILTSPLNGEVDDFNQVPSDNHELHQDINNL